MAVQGESVRSAEIVQAAQPAEDLAAPLAAGQVVLQVSAGAAGEHWAEAATASADVELWEPAVYPAKQQRLRVDVLAWFVGAAADAESLARRVLLIGQAVAERVAAAAMANGACPVWQKARVVLVPVQQKARDERRPEAEAASDLKESGQVSAQQQAEWG